MKCSIMLHLIWVYTACKSTRLGVSSIKRVKTPMLVYPAGLEVKILIQVFIYTLNIQAEKALASLHNCSGLP